MLVFRPFFTCQVAVAGETLVLNVTRRVSSTAWNMTLPEFQFVPIEGSPASLPMLAGD
jgi:hypothetical protein